MKKLVGFFLVALVVGCGTRKTENTKVEEIEKLKAAKLDFSGLISSNTQTDKSIIFVREIYEKGEIKEKQTTTQNNKLDQKVKIEYKYNLITKTIYKTIKVKEKNTDRKEPWLTYLLIFIVAAFLVYFLIKR